jgi:hypothetical protein
MLDKKKLNNIISQVTRDKMIKKKLFVTNFAIYIIEANIYFI